MDKYTIIDTFNQKSSKNRYVLLEEVKQEADYPGSLEEFLTEVYQPEITKEVNKPWIFYASFDGNEKAYGKKSKTKVNDSDHILVTYTSLQAFLKREEVQEVQLLPIEYESEAEEIEVFQHKHNPPTRVNIGLWVMMVYFGLISLSFLVVMMTRPDSLILFTFLFPIIALVIPLLSYHLHQLCFLYTRQMMNKIEL